MDNKKLGGLLIISALGLGIILFTLNTSLSSKLESACQCTDSELGYCPHENQIPWQTYSGMILLSGIAALGVYLVFFEKSQKEIITQLNNHKLKESTKKKFEILLMGLNSNEKKIIRAVRDQEGITQQTLRLRADMHKSKLSIVLSQLEDKNLIKKVRNGKTHKIYTKFTI